MSLDDDDDDDAPCSSKGWPSCLNHNLGRAVAVGRREGGAERRSTEVVRGQGGVEKKREKIKKK